MKIPFAPVIELLHEASHGTLATHSLALPGYPFATVLPYVVDEAHRPVICVSALAEHTKNLLGDGRASLSVLRSGTEDVQAAPRLTFVGEAERFEPEPEFLARYLRYAPETEPLLGLDFLFFRLNPRRIRFIGGIGRMGWIEAEDWARLPRLPAATEAGFLDRAAPTLPQGVRLLGADCLGLDYTLGEARKRLSFGEDVIRPETLPERAAGILAGLAGKP